MKIVDQWGNPITIDALDAPQTEARAGLAHLHHQVAGHPSRGITPARLNEIMLAAELGDLTAQHELFKDMEERDAHVYSELAKRKRATAKLPWDIVPPRNASKQELDLAAWVKEQLQDMADFEDVMIDLLDSISHGFSALELTWQHVGDTWTVSKFQHRPQSWFQLDPQSRTNLKLRDSTANGLNLTPMGWLMHVHRATSGYVSRSGLGRVLVWPYLFKHFSVGDLAEFLDIHGLPLIVGKYPSQATESEKSTLFRAIAGIGHNARGIIPAGMDIEIQQASDSKGDPFLSMINWCERSQSKAINGSTLTSDAGATGLGSGLAEVHNEVRLDIRDSDCKQLAGTITNQLIYPLLAVNKGFNDARRCPRFVFDTSEAEDIKLFADSLPKLVAVGMQIPTRWAHEKLRIPVPDGDKDEVLRVTGAEPAPVAEKQKSNPKTESAPLRAQFLTALAAQHKAASVGDEVLGPQPDLRGMQAVDAAVGLLDDATQDAHMQALLSTVVADIMSADSFEAMQAALDAALERQDVRPLATALHHAGFAATWLGMGDATS